MMDAHKRLKAQAILPADAVNPAIERRDVMGRLASLGRELGAADRSNLERLVARLLDRRPEQNPPQIQGDEHEPQAP